MPLSFLLFPNIYFFNLNLLTLLLPFLSDYLGDTKTLCSQGPRVNRPFGFTSWAIDPQPEVGLAIIVAISIISELNKEFPAI